MEQFPLDDKSQAESLLLAQANILEDSEDNSESSNPLDEFVRNFNSFDSNSDGFLTSEELDQVANQSSNSSEVRRVAGLLSRDVNLVEEYANDEWFDERSGISKADLESFKDSDYPLPDPGFGDWISRRMPFSPGGYGPGILAAPDPLSWGESKVPTRVIHVARGTSAEYAGLATGDLIEKIDGVDITQMAHKDVLDLLNGPRQTNVKLQVNRDGVTKHFEIDRRRNFDINPSRTRYSIANEDAARDDDGNICGPNSEYYKIIRKAARNHYDPFSLGDVSGLVHKYDCQIEDSEGAHSKAQSELSRLTKDSYTKVKDTEEEEHEEEAQDASGGSADEDIVEKDLGDGISYLRLVDFKQNSDVDAMREALERHEDASAIVLDLRGNPGGYFQVALDISSMFVQEGELVRTYNRETSDPANPRYVSKLYSVSGSRLRTTTTPLEGESSYDSERREPYLINDRPVVVLINRQSSSASEVLAGALKDNQAATLVGKRTYGKGIGQSTHTISDEHSLKMTTFRFASPNGTWPGDARGKRYGIQPDKDIYTGSWITKGSDKDKQLKAAIEIINEKLGR